MGNQFHRQRGIVDQAGLAKLRVLVSGTSTGIADVLVLLQQLGVASDGGKIGIFLEDESNPQSVFWNLAFPNTSSFYDLCESNSQMYNLVSKKEGDENWDIHLSMNGSTEFPNSIYGFADGPRALVSRNPIRKKVGVVDNHPLTPSLRIVCASALVERMVRTLGLSNKLVISDAWITVTCRIETQDFDHALEVVRSQGLGEVPVNLQVTSDGLATLARIRIPNPVQTNPFDYIQIGRENNSKLEDLDIGLIPWDDSLSPLDGFFEIEEKDSVILGAGGLGSWCAPLFVAELPSGCVHIVDSDLQVEQHNLNRQVLYDNSHIGLAKATVAHSRLEEINSNVKIIGYIEHLLPCHVLSGYDEFDTGDEAESFDLDDDDETSKLMEALSSSSLYFACLDNMKARTLLNEAALLNGAEFINGGSESVHGIVERMSDEEGCMVCRYGKETANEVEVVSCSEEGVRPIASIVTTTAWAGAMMAAIGLLQASNLSQTVLPRYQWHKGIIERMKVGSKPPWMNESCLRHI